MLSTFAVRSGVFGAHLLRGQAPRALLAVSAKNKSDAVAETDPKVLEARSILQKRMDRWDACNEVFYGPDRDLKNWPQPRIQDYTAKVRMGVIPDDWFTALYEKTGVTGPYLFGVGLVTTLLSKEIWVIDHGFSEVIGFCGAAFIIHRLIKDWDARRIAGMRERGMKRMWDQPMGTAKRQCQKVIDTSEKTIWQEEGQKYLWQAKKENIDLQLEAAYRQRLHQVYKEVKSRLDYQLEIQNVKRRFEQEHMVNWIVDSVRKSITPQQEKDSIKSCLNQLKQMSAAQA